MSGELLQGGHWVLRDGCSQRDPRKGIRSRDLSLEADCGTMLRVATQGMM